MVLGKNKKMLEELQPIQSMGNFEQDLNATIAA